MFRNLGNGYTELAWFAGNVGYARALLPTHSIILDVGGGQAPHPRADVVLDKYPFDNSERMGNYDFEPEPTLIGLDDEGRTVETKQSKPIIVCGDIEAIPFSDKSFSFIVCNNTLEHAEDPIKACQELSRVGQAGFIDVPTFVSEVYFPQGKKHRYTFSREGSTLIAHDIRKFESPFGKIMHDIFANNVDVQEAWSKSRKYLHAVLFWQNEIICKVGEKIQ